MELQPEYIGQMLLKLGFEAFSGICSELLRGDRL